MRMMRSASLVSSVGGTGCLATCDSPENRSDRHAEPRQISLAENMAGHDLASRENVTGAWAIPHHDRGPFVHFHTEISKRDPRAQRISAERRRVEPLRPIGL